MKFGGTSVEDASAFRNVAAIVGAAVALRPVVVVSAIAGFTNALLASVQKDVPMELPIAAAEEKTYPHLLWIGIVMTVAYAVLIDKLGFFLCTFIYLAAFMWIGRYRRSGIILITSLVGSLAFMFMFMKIVYVSLPLGVDPFSQVSFLLMRLMGIK